MPDDPTSGPPDAKVVRAKRPSKKTRPHLPFLDGIRALAALYVVLSHASTNVRGRSVSQFFGYGHFAVDVFIVLSGFSLMLPVAIFGTLKGGARSFLVRRARRIVPPYLFALGFSALLGKTLLSRPTGTSWDVALPVTGRALLAHATLVQDLFPELKYRIDYPLWSVSVESHIYLLFPLIVLLFARHRGWAVTLGAIALGYALQILLSRSPIDNTANGASPYYLGLFVLGCLAALVAVRHANRVGRLPLGFAIGSATLLLALENVHSFLVGGFLPEQAASLFTGVSTAAALVALGVGQWPKVRAALSWRPIATIGTFAYSIYLVHAPVLQLVWKTLVHPLGLNGRRESLALAVVATPIVVFASWLFSIAFERPFIPRVTRRRAPCGSLTKPRRRLSSHDDPGLNRQDTSNSD